MTFETSLKVTKSLFTLCCDLLKSITMNLSILIPNNKLIFVHVMYVRLVVYLLKISTSSHSQRKPRAFPFKK